MTSDRKAELERLKKQYAEQIQNDKLEAEIAEMKAKLEGKEPRVEGESLRGWLKNNGLWKPFILVIMGIVMAALGYLFMPWPLEGIGVLVVILGIFMVPQVRGFVGDILK